MLWCNYLYGALVVHQVDAVGVLGFTKRRVG